MRNYLTNLDNGLFIIQVPEKLSKFDIQYMKDYFEIVIRQSDRRAIADPISKADPTPNQD